MSEPTNAYEILKAARRLISHKDRWCTWASARNTNEAPVLVTDPSAVRWCAVSAISKYVPDAFPDALWIDCMAYLRKGATSLVPEENLYSSYNDLRRPSCVNDYLGHAETMLMYDKAIEYARRDIEDDWL